MHDVLNRFDAPSAWQANRIELNGVAEPAELALSNNKKRIQSK